MAALPYPAINAAPAHRRMAALPYPAYGFAAIAYCDTLL